MAVTAGDMTTATLVEVASTKLRLFGQFRVQGTSGSDYLVSRIDDESYRQERVSLSDIVTVVASNPATGPYGASLNIKVYPTEVNLQAEGADMTGVADAAAAFTAAQNDLPSGGGTIGMPPGIVALPNGFTFTKQIKLRGAGPGAGIGTTGGTTGAAAITAPTKVVVNSQTADALKVQASGCIFEDFALVNTSGAAPTAGTGIKLDTLGHYTRFNRLLVWGFWNNIDIVSGWGWKMLQCDILDPINFGLYDHNLTPNGDAGDPSVDSCLFHAGAYQTATALANLRWESGGGLKVLNTKFNGNSPTNGPLRQVDAIVADGVATTDLILVGNSFENSKNDLVRVGNTGVLNTGTLGNIVVVGNQFAGQRLVFNGLGTQNLTGIEVSANVFRTTSLAAQYTDQLRIGPNTWENMSGITVFDLATGTNTNWLLAPKQAIKNDGIQVLSDGSVSSNHAYQNCNLEFDRDIPSVTSSVTYTTLWRLAMTAESAGTIEMTLTGSVNTRTNFVVSAKRGYQRAGSAACTLTTIGTDTALGTVVDLLFDVAAVTGEVQVKLRLNAAAGGTDIFGVSHIRMFGVGISVRKGA